jgi:hypothetical protein
VRSPPPTGPLPVSAPGCPRISTSIYRLVVAEITVEHIGGTTYRVRVSEGASSSTHEVMVDPDDAARLGGGATAEDLLVASFRFLLDREPKESILSRFDLAVIGRYFPEFATSLRAYL